MKISHLSPLGSGSVFVRHLPGRVTLGYYISACGGAALLGVVSILPNWSNISSPIIFCCLSVSLRPSSQLTNNLGLNSGNLFVLFVFMSSWLPTLLLLGQSTHLFMALSLRTFIPPVSSVLGKSKSYSFLMEANSQ